MSFHGEKRSATLAWPALLLASLLTSPPSAAGGDTASETESPTTAAPSPYGIEILLEGYFIDKFEYPNQPGAMPRVDVSWPEARALCQRRGKRLCTEVEWESACGGPGNFAYGYGSQFQPGRCNTPAPRDGVWRRGPGLAASGTHMACGNDNGIVDLVGNVWEWTDGWYDRDRGWRTVRGGSWFSSANMARTDGRYGRHLSESFRLDLVGFRCCRTARPDEQRPGDPQRGHRPGSD